MVKNISSEKVFLIINSQIYPLLTEVTTLGRKLSNDIVIQNELVSRDHAEIRYEHGQFVIYDKQSTGGSFVNNKRVDRCVLYSGDIISLADTQFMFVNNNSHLQSNESAVTKSLQ
jgi:pSer/pThr/pTyr-binding forkhead associated (FHA) protein